MSQGRLRLLTGRPQLGVESSASGQRRAGVVGAGAWTVVAVASNGLTRLITVVMVGRASGVEALGTFQTGLSTAQLLVLLLPTALGSAASKFVAQGRANPAGGEPGAVYRLLRTRLRGCAVVLSLASVVLWLAVTGRDAGSGVEVAALTAALCWYSVTRGLLFGLGMARRCAFWDITTSVVTVLLIAALWAVNGLQDGALLAVAATYAMFAIVNTPRGAVGTMPAARRREIDRFCLAVVFGTLASAGFLQLTMIVSRAAGGAAAAGHFAAALNLATPVSLLSVSLTLVIFPELSGALSRGDHARVSTLVDRAFRALLCLAVPVLTVVWFAAEPAVRVLLGGDFSAASPVLMILIATVLASTIASPCVTALTSGSQRGVWMSALLSAGGLTVGVASWIVLIPAVGANGVAWGFMLGSLVSAVGQTGWAWRTQRQRWALPVATTVIAVGLLVLVRSGAAGLSHAAAIAAALVICVVWAAVQAPSLVRRWRWPAPRPRA